MDKKIIFPIIGGITLLVGLLVLFGIHTPDQEISTNKLEATVLSIDDDKVMVQDKENVIYTFEIDDMSSCKGENVLLEYTGLLNKNTEIQDVAVIHCDTVPTVSTTGFPDDWQDNGMFSNYYTLAYNQMKKLSLEEKIAQIMLVRYPESNQVSLLKQYQFGGYVFFEKDFKGKTKDQVKEMMSDLQEVSNIPILTAVDEEGGNVVRISSNSNLASEPFASPSELYAEGGFAKIKEDTIKKSSLLKSLGLNLNLAPVVDVTTNPDTYMYDRTLQQDTELTADYAKTVIEASKNSGVSYTLKHFPGYGNNADTHLGTASDTRTYDEILTSDLPPFESGINAGAEAVLVSHNTVTNIDSSNPASLSPSIHNILRNELNFTGIIITDDLSMGATSSIDNAIVKAILAGNDLIITTNYQSDMTAVKSAINDGTLSETTIEKMATRVIAWKYYKGLLFENQK